MPWLICSNSKHFRGHWVQCGYEIRVIGKIIYTDNSIEAIIIDPNTNNEIPTILYPDEIVETFEEVLLHKLKG